MKELIRFETEIVGGLLGDSLNGFVDSFKAGLIEIARWLFEIITPFIDWGSKSVIIICLVIFYLSGDPKAISTSIKAFFVYLIFMMIRSVVI